MGDRDQGAADTGPERRPEHVRELETGGRRALGSRPGPARSTVSDSGEYEKPIPRPATAHAAIPKMIGTDGDRTAVNAEEADAERSGSPA